MTDEMKARADVMLDAAIEEAGQRDPRPFYRIVLRHLRENDEPGFQRALRYFEEELVPAVAGGAAALPAWAEYGLMIGRTLGSGTTVELDPTGRALPVERVVGAVGLVLYIPDAVAAPVLVLRYPQHPSAAQHAAYELLVEGRHTASAYG